MAIVAVVDGSVGSSRYIRAYLLFSLFHVNYCHLARSKVTCDDFTVRVYGLDRENRENLHHAKISSLYGKYKKLDQRQSAWSRINSVTTDTLFNVTSIYILPLL